MQLTAREADSHDIGQLKFVYIPPVCQDPYILPTMHYQMYIQQNAGHVSRLSLPTSYASNILPFLPADQPLARVRVALGTVIHPTWYPMRGAMHREADVC